MNNKNPDWYGNSTFKKKCFGLIMRTLYAPLVATTESLHDHVTFSNYKVPTGKVGVITEVLHSQNLTLTAHALKYGPTVDSAAGGTNLLRVLNLSSVVPKDVHTVTIPVDQFITVVKPNITDELIVVLAEFDTI